MVADMRDSPARQPPGTSHSPLYSLIVSLRTHVCLTFRGPSMFSLHMSLLRSLSIVTSLCNPPTLTRCTLPLLPGKLTRADHHTVTFSLFVVVCRIVIVFQVIHRAVPAGKEH